MPAAIVTGAVGMPLLIWGWKFIEIASHSQLLILVWAKGMLQAKIFQNS
jgi:hypothetical protein